MRFSESDVYMQTSGSKIDAFRELHESGCFVMPNPWDLGSARLLASLGFPAVATTSSGFAATLGKRDGRVTLEEALDHFRSLAAGVDVPVNGDFENGLGADAGAVEANFAEAALTGVAGLSIEDSTGDPADPLFPFDAAVSRVRAARRGIDRSGRRALLTARSEGFIAGRPDLEETIRRLSAYAEAGADCLYAPGIRSRDEIGAVVKAVAPRPVNVLVYSDFTTVADVVALGGRRISVGGALARSAWTGALAAAREIADRGTFTAFAGAIAFSEVAASFESAPAERAPRPLQPAPLKPVIAADVVEKLDVRVGTIVRVDDVPASKKLVKLLVDFGDCTRTILAGLKTERANPEEILGRQALFVVNLEPRTMAGETSEGMLFDIGYADGVPPALAIPERRVPNGTRAG